MNRIVPSVAVAVFLCAVAHEAHAASACSDTWFRGTWRSNPEQSARAFAIRGAIVAGTPSERLKAIFGTHLHVIDTQRFAVVMESPDGSTARTEAEYRVIGCTESTVTLRFDREDWPELVLYKHADCYMVRVQNNFEYFCREQ